MVRMCVEQYSACDKHVQCVLNRTVHVKHVQCVLSCDCHHNVHRTSVSCTRSGTWPSNFVRQHLQQQQAQQQGIVQGFAEYMQRHAVNLLLLCLDAPPPGHGNLPTQHVQPHEFARLHFLLDASKGAVCSRLSCRLTCMSCVVAGGTDAIKAIEPSLQAPGGAALLALSAWLTVHVRDNTPALQDPQACTGSTFQRHALQWFFFLHMAVLAFLHVMYCNDITTNHNQSQPITTNNQSNQSQPMTESVPSPPCASGAPCGEEITGIHKNTIARGPGAFARNQARISDCHDATIYALAPLDCISISCCSDCVVVVGAVGKLIRVERCVRLQLIAVCRRIYINASHDCIFYLGTNQPPVLLGDNRFVQVCVLRHIEPW